MAGGEFSPRGRCGMNPPPSPRHFAAQISREQQDGLGLSYLARSVNGELSPGT